MRVLKKEFIGCRAPLFGRASAKLRLRPLRFIEALGFMSSTSIEDALRTYTVLGGTPAYLKLPYGRRRYFLAVRTL